MTELNNPKREIALCWLAMILTAGEYTLAIFLLVNGHWEAIFLAITYTIRETKGGKHYHEIVVAAIHRIYFKRKEHSDN